MSKANWWTKPHSGVKYAVTLMAVASAIVVAWMLWHFWHSEAFASVFFCAIIFSAWFGGFRQGLLGVTVSAVAFDYFFLSPIHSLYLDSSQLPRLTIFVVSALIMCFLTASQRTTSESLSRAQDDLNTNIQELKRINEELRAENYERKLTQVALRQSQAYLAEAQRLSHTGSFGWRVATGEIIWSEETFRIFEYDRTTTPTVDVILQRIHPQDAPLVQQTIERAHSDGKDFELEHRLVMPDGSVKHVHIVAHGLSDESGTVEFVGAVMDITERKRAAEALLRTEAYLAEGQKLSHTGTWACDIATREMIHSSPEHRHLFGLARERVGIPPFEEFYQRIHPDDRGATVADLERAMAGGTDVEAHFRVVLPEGTTRFMHGIGHPLVKPFGETGEFVGTVMDVTAAKRSEEALQRSESYLAEAQRLTHTGSWAFNVTTPLYWSEENFRIWGFDPVQGLPDRGMILQRIHSEDRGRLLEEVQKAVHERRDYDVELRIVLPDGAIRYIHALGHPVFSSTGELVEVVGTNMDVTERKGAEEALRQAQGDLAHVNRVTTMGELTASLAHEIKQPIAAAVTNANTCLRWLRRDCPNLEEAGEAASRMVKDVMRATDIISSISMLFKKGASQRELVDVNELIQEMIVLLRSEANRYSILIRSELAEGLPKVLADRVRLQQVFMNLMVNGIDAMKGTTARGELTIKSEAGNGQLLISVSDTGVGLPPNQTEQIFQAFFTTKDNGTGMGLPISRSIIESHGGRLWASGAAGAGTTLQFTLPIPLRQAA
ncbi:MAG TPA: PAS domain-containing protein [Candidatus Sulfotelmatobacter sp.]|nr:PAS domain-containing protein [Candidatus Sulfotelmatobacter sp.]